MKTKRKEILKEILSWIVLAAAAFLLAFLINSKAYANTRVEQSSMENTLYNNNRLIVDELSYQFREPGRGDIITFYRYEEKGSLIKDFTRTLDNFISNIKTGDDCEKHERLIKRVIGIEGDTIDIINGAVYRNGERLQEPYAKGATDSKGLQTPIKVGKDQLFVLGDNRVVSVDSREIGLINLKQVEGKALLRIFPFNKFGKVK